MLSPGLRRSFLLQLALTCTVLFGLGAVPYSLAQAAEGLSQVKKLFVEPLGSDKWAAATRAKLIHRIQKGSGIQIVESPNEADAVLTGTARIWTLGQASLSPKSHSLVEPTLEGFLSVEVIGKQHQTLWSYLVTPGKFSWSGISDDLARQLASRLNSAIMGSTQPEQPGNSGTTNARSALKGAGATFPAPLYLRWFELFSEDHPGVQINYDPVGSGEGIRRLSQGEVDFAGSEMPLTDQAEAEVHSRIKQVPIVLGGVVPIYNVSGVHQNLNFTPEILSAIYLGKLTKWNDPEIRKVNSGVSLPDAEIVVVHRSDGSGTTFVWSDFLSKVSPQWKTAVGSGVTLQWPVGIGAEHNEGVATKVQQTPNSIGYVELIYAIQHQLLFGAVRNASGQFVKADISSVTAAARASRSPDSAFRVSLTDSTGKTAYPISTYTWFLLPEQVDDKDKKASLLALLHWMLTEGQKSCSALGYAPLPAEVANRALQSIEATP